MILRWTMKVSYKWILVQIRRLLKWLEKVHLEVLIIETFILVLLEIGTKNHGKNSISGKILINCSHYYEVSVNKYGVKCGTSLRFWEHKRWMNEIDLYWWFQWYFRYGLDRRPEDDERRINTWKGIVSRFRGKLVKIIKDAGSKFDNYSISSKIRQILLHWRYELTEKYFLLTWF